MHQKTGQLNWPNEAATRTEQPKQGKARTSQNCSQGETEQAPSCAELEQARAEA
ncbi:hypothetical protein LguiA_002034 [Lonicera macranthoides]